MFLRDTLCWSREMTRSSSAGIVAIGGAACSVIAETRSRAPGASFDPPRVCSRPRNRYTYARSFTLLRSLRLVVQDTALSRREHEFEPRRERHYMFCGPSLTARTTK